MSMRRVPGGVGGGGGDCAGRRGSREDGTYKDLLSGSCAGT